MKILQSLLILILFTACNVKVSPIEYGQDSCSSCKMGIVDQKHASQLVTQKGKNYKFDAIECMVSYLKKDNVQNTDYAYILVADLLNPGELIQAEKASFIISKNIPSPMGAFLSATKNKQQALELTKEFTGEVLTFEEIQNK
ncbi:nitrous oxide reductase accessory protein NosL [Myroides pelagicus]|uniref:Uncharacterized protein n=1 Tax=Myroides pelagicus TaxID=270914 RepID=A0A7K1GPV2_9FLAO|nr:nitrous oxide reductase accessory protein NosL [Myroides pelagicus]MEC4114849.1 nitrous oxide reductase accessory protein NosL [Myroides pelagicus]MTH30760.1 hypothetical protein [Myroides pelagicus]